MDVNEQIVENSALDEMEGRYLTFWTDGQLYSIPIADVVQIIRMQEITVIPEFPSYAIGVINLRGEIVPVIDVRIRFHKKQAEYTDYACIIVTNIRGKLFGFLVDRVNEVTEKISKDNITGTPAVGRDSANRYMTGVARMDDQLVLMLKTSSLLGERDFEMLTQVVSKMAANA